MKKYGLQLRVPPAQKTSKPLPPRPPPPFAFGGEDEDDIEREISRQAAKNKALQKIEEQHKKAMEQDPSVFDYDGVYDEMKEQIARPKFQDRTERKTTVTNKKTIPFFGHNLVLEDKGIISQVNKTLEKSRYIETLMEKAKEREREHEIVYEKKLLKERSKEDHLFADKEKFVTSAYKKKLAEQAKWLEEERLMKIREEREDVTKKTDLSDFYFGLSKNVAYGARSEDSKLKEQRVAKDAEDDLDSTDTNNANTDYTRNKEQDDTRAETSRDNSEQVTEVTKQDVSQNHAPGKENTEGQQSADIDVPTNERFKRCDDAVAAARERYLARKRAREQL